MSFGENLQFLRRRRELTQEELAEQLNVSRQSVSKWESDAAYPEMDTIIKLCDLFFCDMDTLLRGDVSRLFGTDTAGYDRHMNAFARAIAAGVALILGGITLLLLVYGWWGSDRSSLAGTLLFLGMLTVAVAIFIASGMNHNCFVKKHPAIEPFYSPEQIDRFDRQFPILIAGPVALIFLGVLCTVAFALVEAPAGWSSDRWDTFGAAALLLCITVAAAILTWAGIQKSKYDISAYNREQAPTPEQKQRSQRTGALWGCSMVGATAVYVGLGLALDLWDQAWVIYPVAALICVAVTIFLNRDQEA